MKKIYKEWMKKYYPIPASKMKNKSMVNAVQHSLNKWIGLTDLDSYNLIISYYGELVDMGTGNIVLQIDADTCALCEKYLMLMNSAGTECENCPLAIVRGGVPCFQKLDMEVEHPYGSIIMMDYPDPRPMIRWLKKALKYAQKQEGK